MRIFGSDRMDGMLSKLGLKEDEAIVHPWINKAIERAQAKVEARNFDIRKNILKYDNVMNDQRKVVFEQRKEFMAEESVRDTIDDMRHGVIDDMVSRAIPQNAYAEQWNVAGLKADVLNFLNLDLPVEEWAKEEGIADDEIRERITKAADAAYAERIEANSSEVMTYVEKQVLLQSLDHLWREHLVTLDHLRQVIGWRGLAQRDPLNEYKSEAFELFNGLVGHLGEQVTGQLDARPGGVPAAGTRRIAAHVRPAPRSRDGRKRDGDGRIAGAGARLRRHRGASSRQCPAARSHRPLDLGTRRPQRAVPMRVGPEVQALPRPVRRLNVLLPSIKKPGLSAGLFRFPHAAGISPSRSPPVRGSMPQPWKETCMQRRLAAIMVADIVGYSSLMEQAEERTAARVDACQDLIQQQVAALDGRVFNTAGDASFVEFASPINALRCATEIRTALAGTGDGEPLRLRFGLHLADVVIRGEDLVGDGVNVAARIQQDAEPDTICVSGVFFDNIRRNSPFHFDDLGDRNFKNMAEPIHIYRLRGEMASHRMQSAPTRTKAVGEKRPSSVAVLPFRVTGGDEDQRFWPRA